MEAINLILSALAIGATSGAQSTAGEAIKDAYNGLKSLITHRFTGKKHAQEVLVEYESDPAGWKKPLRELTKIS